MTTITATYLDPSGDPAKGRVCFTLSAPTYQDTLDAIIPQVTVTAALNGNGQMSIELEPTSGVDCQFEADGLTYVVNEYIKGAERDPYYIDVPSTATIDLGELVNYVNPPAVAFHARWVDDPDIGALTDRLDNIGIFNVRDVPYLASGDNVTDDTEALQAAIDAAHVDGGIVFLPPGEYVATQLTMKHGVWLKGCGFHSYGHSNTPVAQIVQKAGAEQDLIIFEKDGATQFIVQCQISDLILRHDGDETGTVGSGIVTRDADDTELAMQDGTRFHGIMVRGFPEDGLKIWGSVPGNIDNIYTLFNNGYGVSIRQSANPHSLQMASLTNHSHDGNSLGGILIKDLADYSVVNLWAIKSEHRTSYDWPAVTEAQEHAIVFEDCEGVVNLNGMLHIRSGEATTKPGDAFVVQGTAGTRPEFHFQSCQVRILDTQIDGDDPVMLRDDVSSPGLYTIPITMHSGTFGTGPTRLDTNLTGAEWHYGIPGQVSPAVGNPVFSVGGVTPTIALWESDADANEKSWAIVASSGALFVRAILDDGSLGEIVLQMSRTAGDVTATTLASSLTVSGGVGFHGTTAPGAKPTVVGSRGGNAALGSLLSTLAGLGMLTDGTS